MANVFRQLQVTQAQAPNSRAAVNSQFSVLTNILITTLAAAIPFHNRIPDPPHRPLPRAADWVTEYRPPNLLTTTLAPSTGEPRAPVLTRPAELARQDLSHIHGMAQALRTPPIQPFRQTEWPLTRVNPRVPEPTQTLNPNTALTTYPFRQSEWPLTRINPRVPEPTQQINLNTTLFSIPLMPPFYQTDWFNHRASRAYFLLEAPLYDFVAQRSPVVIPGLGTRATYSFPPVPEFMPDDKEHRRQIARTLNMVRQGKLNTYIDIVLTPGATSTTITDPRIGVASAICPAMPMTANAALAVAAGIWITNQKSGSATVNHANSANPDQTIRFTIIG